MSHFDRRGGAADYVLSALRAYRRLGGEILVVSSAELTASARARLGAHADRLVERENVGLDFASWRAGLELSDMGRGQDEVIIVNDSVFGPFADISPMLASLSRPHIPVHGMTINREFCDHIQSWFVGFNMRVFPRSLFEGFWAGVVALPNKSQIIRQYEIGLSNRILAAGLPLSAEFDMRARRSGARLQSVCRQVIPERLSLRTYRELYGAQHSGLGNPTMYHWHELLRGGVPFVKVELLRDNPVGVCRSLVQSAIAAFGSDFAREASLHLAGQ